MLAESGDIVFPKLDEDRDMIPFDRVARELLRALGMEADECHSEAEAREKMMRLRAAWRPAGPIRWPVHFFESDTSGEKAFEEFYTPEETLDLQRFAHLGVVKQAGRRSLAQVDQILQSLEAIFSQDRVSKAEIVAALKGFLPNFEHIETGKGLDQKM